MSKNSSTRMLTNFIQLGLRETMAPLQNQVWGTSTPLGCRPTNVNIEIINSCCLRCQMCDIWKNHPHNELSVHEWMNVIHALKDWLGSFRLTITGGEPFMKLGIWEFLEACIRQNLPTVVITNGFCFNLKSLDRLTTMQLSQVVISIDSLNPDVHNKIRGLPNAYERTWETIRFLAEHRPPFILASSTVIMDDNILELGQIASGLAAVGVRRIFLQPVQGGFTTAQGTWPYDTALWPSSSRRVEAGFDDLLKVKQQGVPIANSEQELMDFKEYFLQGAQWRRPWTCPVGFTTFHCDSFGQVRMCVPFAGNVGSLRTQRPSDIWNSALADIERGVIRSCQKACMLNCTRQYTVAEKLNLGISLIQARVTK